MTFEEAKEVFLNRGLVDSGLSNDSTELGNRTTLMFNKNKWDESVRKISEMLRGGELVPVGHPVVTNPSVKITGNVSMPIWCIETTSSEYLANYVAHNIATSLAPQLIPYIDFSLGHDNPPDEKSFYRDHTFEGSINVAIAPHDTLDRIKRYFDYVHSCKKKEDCNDKRNN